MSEMAKKAREAAREKAHRMANGDPHAKVDGSSWHEAEALNADAQTGERPVSKRQFKRGGKVMGEHEKKRADRRPRKSGGSANADAYINRDVKAANDERPGTKHIGGMKKGGRAKKADGGDFVPTQRMAFQGGPSQMSRAAGLKHGGHADEAEDKKLIRREVKNDALKRDERARGGPIGYHAVNNEGYVIGRRKTEGGIQRHIDSLAASDTHGAKSGVQIKPIHNQADWGLNDHPSMKRGGRKHGGRADAHWIAGAIKHPGALHRELNVADDKRIPAKKLEKAEHSKNKLVAKRAHLAETLRGMHKKGGGGVDVLDGTNAGSGRIARKDGGRASGKGKMNVNIIIAQKPDAGMAPGLGAAVPQMPPKPPMGPIGPGPMAGPAPGAPPPMMPPGGAPPMMGRKHGGRAYEAGAGSGLGRLEKVENYGHQGHRG